MNGVIVFLGPTLALTEAREIIGAEFRSPASQGDMVRAANQDPSAIAIIDGVFKDAPTVRHREILWALSRGIPVFGASSMGALRAAELHTHGMIGTGLIYRWYRRFQLTPDDAVAVTHAPEALGSTPLSDALVDIRLSLKAAQRAGVIDNAKRLDLTRHMTGLPFVDRHMSSLPETIRSHHVTQKANDARTLLRQLARHQSHNDWPTPRLEQPPIVHAWLDDLKAGLIDPAPVKNTKKD